MRASDGVPEKDSHNSPSSRRTTLMLGSSGIPTTKMGLRISRLPLADRQSNNNEKSERASSRITRIGPTIISNATALKKEPGTATDRPAQEGMDEDIKH